MNTNSAAKQKLHECRVDISPDTYSLISVMYPDWTRLLESPELSPRMTSPFMIFYDGREVTMLLDETDLGTMRHALRDAKVERGFRMLTFDIELEFSVVGFISEISGILAEAGVSIVALSAFSRDHLLIKQDDLAKALKALGPYVAELC